MISCDFESFLRAKFMGSRGKRQPEGMFLLLCCCLHAKQSLQQLYKFYYNGKSYDQMSSLLNTLMGVIGALTYYLQRSGVLFTPYKSQLSANIFISFCVHIGPAQPELLEGLRLKIIRKGEFSFFTKETSCKK